MMAASQRICGVLKEDFLPMIPYILPQTLEKFTLTPKSLEDLQDGDQEGEINLTMTRTEDGHVKFIFMSTAEVEDLECALQSVHTYIDELKAGFAPFIADVAKALVPVFDFGMDETIRE